MGKDWDHSVPGKAYWAECLRVLKPGGYLLAFAGTRTQHRMATAIEDAGFEIRDMIAWCYGSGFPKSHNVANSIDKSQGQPDRGRAIPVASTHLPVGKYATEALVSNKVDKYTARTEDGAKWDGWGTALKPALEPITMARKPLIGTVAANVLAHGTGGINIDGCRIEGVLEGDPNRFAKTNGGSFNAFSVAPVVRNAGRWPANLMLDEEAAAIMDEQSGCVKGGVWNTTKGARVFNNDGAATDYSTTKKDTEVSGASRFFYTSKPGKKERNAGLPAAQTGNANHHPTVKPIDVMRYLCRLVTPPGGVVLDPFLGSGTTGCAAVMEGFGFIGIEREAEYVKIAQARISAFATQAGQTTAKAVKALVPAPKPAVKGKAAPVKTKPAKGAKKGQLGLGL